MTLSVVALIQILGNLEKGPSLYVNSSLNIYNEIAKGKYHVKKGTVLFNFPVSIFEIYL
jgi:hypothetical protein